MQLLNGIYDAKLDGQPVLAITGLQFHDLLHTHTQQDVELDKLFMDSCAYSARIMGPTHVENVVELAIRTAPAYRQPTHVTMPVDIPSMPAAQANRPKRNLADHVPSLIARDRPLPARTTQERAAATLQHRKTDQ